MRTRTRVEGCIGACTQTDRHLSSRLNFRVLSCVKVLTGERASRY